jgi:hypothetical protein
MSDDDLIRRGDAVAVLRDEIDLARIAMPQCAPILADDMRAIAALPAVDVAGVRALARLTDACRRKDWEAASDAVDAYDRAAIQEAKK